MLIMSPVLMDLVHCDDVSGDNGDDDSDNEDNTGKGIDDRQSSGGCQLVFCEYDADNDNGDNGVDGDNVRIKILTNFLW